MVTLGGQKLPYTSLLGLVAGIAALLWLVRNNSPEDIALAAGVTIIALLVLLHASVGHRRRNAKDEWSELDEGEGRYGIAPLNRLATLTLCPALANAPVSRDYPTATLVVVRSTPFK